MIVRELIKKLQKCDQNKEVFNDNVEWGCCGGCL